MQVRTVHLGRDLPFERERRLVLQGLPLGATITRATITVSPYSTDPGNRFLETIGFTGDAGDWGAAKTATARAVEVDLRARRRLAALVGTNLTGGSLLVDLGGGFMAVNSLGGLGSGAPFPVDGGSDLPGLTATGLRIAEPTVDGPDVTLLRVTSPPTNVTIAVEGGPVFWTHLGELVGGETTPDFADLLQSMLPGLDVVDGYYRVPFVLHSDSIARLDLDLAIDHTLTVAGSPDGVGSVQLPYAYGGNPDAAAGLLLVRVPPGMVASPGGTRGRARGAFQPSRVVLGAVGTPPGAEQPVASADGPLAAPLEVTDRLLASSVDLRLTAVTARAALSVDVVEDLDGKPGRASLLPAPAELSLSRDQAPGPTWVNVPLGRELELAGTRCWVLVHARSGTAAWSAAAAGRPGPGLQHTRDGGLSWRQVAGADTPGPLEAHLRLRHRTPTFSMPLELRVRSGAVETPVSLQRFAATGAVDIDLSFPEVAGAITATLEAGGGLPAGEQVANGDFAEWFRVGDALQAAGTLTPDPVEVAGDDRPAAAPVLARASFAPDGSVVHLCGRDGGGDARGHFLGFDPLTRQQLYANRLPPGEPVAVAAAPDGTYLVVALSEPAGTSPELASTPGTPDRLVLASARTGDVLGQPIDVPERIVAMTFSADGSALYLLGADDGTVLRRLGWPDLITLARRGVTNLPGTGPGLRLAGAPRACAVAPDGRVYAVTEPDVAESVAGSDPAARLVALDPDLTGRPIQDVETLAGVRDLAISAPGDRVLILADAELRVLRRTDLRAAGSVTVRAGLVLATDPLGPRTLVLQDDRLGVYDGRRRRLRDLPDIDATGRTGVVVSPTGSHAVLTGDAATRATLLRIGDLLPSEWELTAGRVRPLAAAEPTAGVLAVLGEPDPRKQRTARGTSGLPAAGPSSISQVTAIRPGQRYRFGFAALADTPGAVAELIWRGNGCEVARTDRVPVQVYDQDRDARPGTLPRHELVVSSPPGADQAEIRLRTAEGTMGVDAVTLAGSADVLADLATVLPVAPGTGWQPSGPTITATPAGGAVRVTNGGPVTGTLDQLVDAAGGSEFTLLVVGRVAPGGATGRDTAGRDTGPAPAVEVTFRDETARAVGEPVRLDLDPLAFDRRAAAGTVPAGAVDASVRLTLPPGAIVELARLSLLVDEPRDLRFGFVSEAPGDLTVTGLAVGLDVAPGAATPVPLAGLCTATPPVGDGGAGDCYCSGCGQRQPVRRATAVTSAAGRPGSVTPCPTCGTPRIVVGGPPGRVREFPLPSIPLRPAGGGSGRVALARLRVDAHLTEIAGIGPARARQLATIGVDSLPALAAAGPVRLAALPGISTARARVFVADATALVRDRGTWVLFDDS